MSLKHDLINYYHNKCKWTIKLPFHDWIYYSGDGGVPVNTSTFKSGPMRPLFTFRTLAVFGTEVPSVCLVKNWTYYKLKDIRKLIQGTDSPLPNSLNL